MWRYYQQVYANGVRLFFRQEDENNETYRYRAGWYKNDELFERKRNGEIDQFDIITEERAFELLRSLGQDPKGRAVP